MQALPGRVGERADPPHGVQVAVDRAHRAFRRTVGERVAVVGRADPGDLRGLAGVVQLRDGLRRRCLVREDRQPVVVRVGCERDRVRAFDVAVAVTDRAPAFRPQPVAVSDKKIGAVGQSLVQSRGVGGHRRGVEDGPVRRHRAGEQPRGRGVHQPLTVSADQQRLLRGRRPHDRLRVLDPEHGERRRFDRADGGPQGHLVGERDPRRVGDRRPEAAWRVQTRGHRVGEQLPGERGTRSAEALVLQVAAQHDVADSHQPGDVGERAGLEHPFLQPAVQGTQQIGGCGGAEGDQFADQVGTIRQPGHDRIESGPPPVVGEIRAGKFQDTGGGPGRVESRGDLPLVTGDRLGAVEPPLDELAAPQRAQVRHDQDDHDHPRRAGSQAEQPRPGAVPAGGAAGARTPAFAYLRKPGGQPFADRGEPTGEQHRQAECHQRHRAGHGPQREAGRGRLGERAERRAQR